MKTQKTNKNKTQSFKDRYNSLETFKQAQDLLKSMTTEDLIEMRDAMEIMQKYTGLDMREEFLQKMIPYEIEDRARQIAPVQEISQ